MSEDPAKKPKGFWAWQDGKEEERLGEVSRQGLHVKHPGTFGQYTFEQGAPRAYARHLGFVPVSKKTEDYFQLFRNAGWERVGADWAAHPR